MATITEDYVSFETAKLLKEKGFNEPIQYFYKFDSKELYRGTAFTNTQIGDKFYNAPTLQMTMEWIRTKGFHIYFPIEIDYDEDERGNKWYHDVAYYLEIRRIYDGKIMYDDSTLYATPEQACEAAIKYCLENLI